MNSYICSPATRIAIITLALLSCSPCSGLNNRPIIGVLTVPLDVGGCVTYASEMSNTLYQNSKLNNNLSEPTSCFHNLYVQWLESGGARVVPIPYDSPKERLDYLFEHVNGMLFTGGDVYIKNLTSPYMVTANYLMNRVIDANNKGIHFPLWGTCMGIQTLSVLVSQDPSVLLSNKFDSENLMLPLNFTDAAKSSKLFGAKSGIYPSVLDWFSTEPVTTNLHHDGVPPTMFQSNAKLKKFFSVLSVNTDRKGNAFTSTIEAQNYPVYGVQWHPERPQFEWGTDGTNTDPINHDMHAISCSQYVANFYIAEARKNNNRFPSLKEETAALIYNYDLHGDTYYQVYLF